MKLGRTVVYDRRDLDAWVATRKRRRIHPLRGTARPAVQFGDHAVLDAADTGGPIRAPARAVFYKNVEAQHLRPASGATYTVEQIAAAQGQAVGTEQARHDHDVQRTGARREALGEPTWVNGKG
jgi:hypothetical protein